MGPEAIPLEHHPSYIEAFNLLSDGASKWRSEHPAPPTPAAPLPSDDEDQVGTSPEEWQSREHFRVGQQPPMEDDIRQLLSEIIRSAQACHESEQTHEQELMANGKISERIFQAVNELLTAIQAAKNPTPPAIPEIFPVWVEDLLEPNLRKLADHVHPRDWYLRNKPGRGKKLTGPSRPLSQAVIRAHLHAKDLLERCKIKPTIGSSMHGGATLTTLGKLICEVAGIKLHSGESTAAAEYVAGGLSQSSGRIWPHEPLPPLTPRKT